MPGLLVTLAVLTACKSEPEPIDTSNPQDTGDTGAAQAPVPPEFGSMEWSRCAQGAGRCGILTVPIDHDDASKGTLDIDVTLVKATGEATGTVFMHFGSGGGPWDAGAVNMAQHYGTPSMRRDKNLLVLRGRTGSATHFCPGAADVLYDIDRSPDTEAERQALRLYYDAYGEACAAAPEVLAHLGPVDQARDIEWLRIAVGEEKLDGWFLSYGGTVGSVYATLFPTTTGRFVIDSPLHPAVGIGDWAAGQFEAQSRILDAGLDACDADPECAFGDGDARAALDQLLTQLDQTPIVDDNGQANQAMLEVALVQLPYDVVNPSTYNAALVDMLTAVQAGDASPLWASRWSPEQTANVLHEVCAHSAPVPFESSEAAYASMQSTQRHLAPFFGWSAAHCQNWPHPPKWDGTLPPPNGRTLVLGGTDDFATPLEWARELAAALDAPLITSDRWGHGQTDANACTIAAVDQFFADGTLPEGDITCSP